MKIEQLISARRSGVFRFNIGKIDVPALSIPEDITHQCVASTTVCDKTAFLKEMAKALRFPQHFGHNWDAAYDCLTDSAEQFTAGLLLSFNDLSRFARDDPDEFSAAVGVLVDGSQYWEQSGKCLIVLIGLDQALLASELAEVSPC